MISYDTSGIQFLWNLFQVRGSVFPKAWCFAGPNAVISAVFVYCASDIWLENPPLAHYQPLKESVMNNNAVWGGFSFLIGFTIVFRTQQAYCRFWEGCTEMHKMGAEWFDCCSSLVAFCKHAEPHLGEEVLQFQNLLVRLFSLLHAAACGQIEGSDQQNYQKVVAFNMELIDPECIDPDTMETIQNEHAKVELIFQWIQTLIVEQIKPGILSIPPPILSRAFQEIANGMVHFHEALKIANVPFPFPYAQICDALLVIHWLFVPFVVSQWVSRPWWAAMFSFIQVFTFWCLNLIALELENPFGTDANDIDGSQMHFEMNERLRLLLRSSTKTTPQLLMQRFGQQYLVERACADEVTRKTGRRTIHIEPKTTMTYQIIWDKIEHTKTMRNEKSMSGEASGSSSPRATGSRGSLDSFRPTKSFYDEYYDNDFGEYRGGARAGRLQKPSNDERRSLISEAPSDDDRRSSIGEADWIGRSSIGEVSSKTMVKFEADQPVIDADAGLRGLEEGSLKVETSAVNSSRIARSGEKKRVDFSGRPPEGGPSAAPPPPLPPPSNPPPGETIGKERLMPSQPRLLEPSHLPSSAPSPRERIGQGALSIPQPLLLEHGEEPKISPRAGPKNSPRADPQNSPKADRPFIRKLTIHGMEIEPGLEYAMSIVNSLPRSRSPAAPTPRAADGTRATVRNHEYSPTRRAEGPAGRNRGLSTSKASRRSKR